MNSSHKIRCKCLKKRQTLICVTVLGANVWISINFHNQASFLQTVVSLVQAEKAQMYCTVPAVLFTLLLETYNIFHIIILTCHFLEPPYRNIYKLQKQALEVIECMSVSVSLLSAHKRDKQCEMFAWGVTALVRRQPDFLLPPVLSKQEHAESVQRVYPKECTVHGAVWHHCPI